MTTDWQFPKAVGCNRVAGYLLLILSLVLPGYAIPGEEAGGLYSRGEGSGAQRHSLPATAIDTKELPYTRLPAAQQPDNPLPVYRLNEDTWFLYGNIATINDDNRGFNGNAGFIVTTEGVVVIDALGTPLLGRRLIATIRSVTDQPIRYLIMTHNHPDHAYGASAFRALDGLTVIAHPGNAEYLGSETMQRSVEYRRNLLTADMQGFSAVQADIQVPPERFARYRLELGGKTFDIYNAGQHHSHGDLVVHQVDDEIVWTSDLVFNQRVTYLGDGNSEQILSGLDWLEQQFGDARLMVPGHGSAQRPPFPMLQATRDYVEQMRALIGRHLEAGESLLDAVDHSDLPAWQDVPLYEENQRANAGFIYREMEFDFF